MKTLLLIYTTLFIQLSFSQNSLSNEPTDTITFDNKFIKLYNKHNKTENFRQPNIVFKIDSTSLVHHETIYHKYKELNINILFRNKTNDLIFIQSLGGGSNYFAEHGDLFLFPNEQKSVKMTMAFTYHKKIHRVIHFRVYTPNKEYLMITKKHFFEFTDNKRTLKVK